VLETRITGELVLLPEELSSWTFVHARFVADSSETHVIFYNYDIARDKTKTKGSKMASSAGDSDYQWTGTTSWGIEVVNIRSRQIRCR